MGVVVQELVPADVAGVLFTRNPVTGVAERVIEASWGLGEAVVAGLVVPDRYRLDARGRVLERSAGEKDVAVRAGRAGTQEVAVSGRRRPRPVPRTTRSWPRCTASPRPVTRSTASGTTTSSSPSRPAGCSSCSGARSPVAEGGTWRRPRGRAARCVADAAQLDHDRRGAARHRARPRPPSGHGGAGAGRELSRRRDRAAEPGRQAGRPARALARPRAGPGAGGGRGGPRHGRRRARRARGGPRADGRGRSRHRSGDRGAAADGAAAGPAGAGVRHVRRRDVAGRGHRAGRRRRAGACRSDGRASSWPTFP